MAKSKAAEQTSPITTNVMPITRGRPRALGAEATDSAHKVGATDLAPAVVVFGKDEAGKAHASRFGEADAELAIKAAGLMGFQVLRVTSPEIASKALEVPLGRIFESSGRGFVPFCRTAVFEALCGFDGAFAPPPPPEPQPEPPLAVTGTPQRWEDIGIGSLVLASTGEDQGWFEAIVAEARGEGLYVLRWQGWLDDPAFVRRADGLALLPTPAVAAAAAATA